MSTMLKRETTGPQPAAVGDGTRVRDQMRKVRERMLKVQHRNDPSSEDEVVREPVRPAMRNAEDATEEIPSLLNLSDAIDGAQIELEQQPRSGPRVLGL